MATLFYTPIQMMKWLAPWAIVNLTWLVSVEYPRGGTFVRCAGLTSAHRAHARPQMSLQHPEKELTVKHAMTRTLTGLLLGLGVALSVAAQSVDGEVKKIDLDAGKLTLKHGEIKNLDMPAMQMSFRVSDPNWLKTLQVGDKVKFSADKVGGQFTVTAIEVRK